MQITNKRWATLLFTVLFTTLLASCGSDSGSNGTQKSDPTPGPDWKLENVRIHSYSFIHKMSDTHHEKRLFHNLVVDIGAEAVYNIRYKGTTLNEKTAYVQIRCTATPMNCEVWNKLVSGGAYERAMTSSVSISEDSTSKRRTIEVEEPNYLDYENDDSVTIQAEDKAGLLSEEISAKITRQ